VPRLLAVFGAEEKEMKPPTLTEPGEVNQLWNASEKEADHVPIELNVLESTVVEKKLDTIACISQHVHGGSWSVLTDEISATKAQINAKISSKLPEATRALDRLVRSWQRPRSLPAKQNLASIA